MMCTTDNLNRENILLDECFCVTCGLYGKNAFGRFFERWREFHLHDEEHERNLEANKIYERDTKEADGQ